MREDFESFERGPLALGSRLRAERKRQGLTIEDLALQANLGARAVGEIERGKPTAQLAGVLRVIDALGLTLALEHRDG